MIRRSTITQFFRHDRSWLIAFGIMFCIYLYLAGLLMTSYDFNDETEKFVAARLMHSGLSLYKDIFVQHGPVAYIPSQIFYSIFKSHSLAFYRIIPIILSIAALFSVMASPLYTTKRSRLLAGILFLFGLAAFQAHYGFVMTMYQVYAGYFYVISLAIFVLPFSIGIQVKPQHAFIAGFCLAMVFFCAFSFAFSIFFCLILCAVGFFYHPTTKNNPHLLRCSLVGSAIGSLLVGLWVWFYGDIKSYFIYHIYFNLTSYKVFLGGVPFLFDPIRLLNPFFIMSERLRPHYIGLLHLLTPLVIALFGLSVFRLKLLNQRICNNILFFMVVLCIVQYANPRISGGCGGSTYVITCIGIIPLITCFIIERANLLTGFLSKTNIIFIALFISIGVYSNLKIKTFLYEVTSNRYYRHKAALGPLHNEEMGFLRRVIGEDEKILQLPFSLFFYVHADRTPASGIFFWLPWMNHYAKDPIKGYPLDLCSQMNENPPKAIHYTDMPIWKNHTDTFMLCFKKLLSERYFLSKKVANVWFRDDIVASDDEVLATSFIPEKYEHPSLSKEDRARINNMKVHYARLGEAKARQCILPSKENNGPLLVGSCDSKEALNFGFSKDRNKLFSLPSHQCLDLHKDPQSHNYLLRLWPCIDDTPYQNFTAEKVRNGFYIRNHLNSLCLAIEGESLITGSCNKATKWKFL